MACERDSRGRFLVGTDPGPGRSSGYDPAMDDQAYKLALLGLTNDEMAKFFGINVETFHAWRREFDGFSDAILRGKEIADAEVAASLYKRATGMVVMSERAMKNKAGDVIVAQTKTEIPPDSRAAVHWLANRRRKKWGTAEEQADAIEAELAEEAGTAPEALKAMTREDLQQRIRLLEARRKQDEEK